MSRTKLGRTAAAVLALLAIGFFVAAGVMLSKSKVSSYKPTQGTLVKRTTVTGGQTRLAFSYQAKGQQHLLEQDVPSGSPDATIPVGGKHALFYDRQHVGHASLERPSLLLPLTLTGAAAIALAAAGLVFYLTRTGETR